jgi:RND family efflux transporter MFP subunit
MNMLTRIEPEAGTVSGTAMVRFRSLPKWQRSSIFAAPVALLIAGGAILANRSAPAPATPPAPMVTVAAPIVRDVTEWDDYIGRFEASQSVEVRPRVSGAITAVHFHDGEIVRQGQLLFTIDSRPFAAALAEARAGLASARSDLVLAQADLGRALRLLEVDAVSRSDVDRLRARVQATQAALAGAEARVRARALDVEFTQIRAPIGGRISDRRVDAGNLVSAAEGAAGSLLTTINALDPIYFTFDASESLFLKTRREHESGGRSSPVEIRLQDETDYRWRGALDFTDNALDPHSGTIRGRAVLRNPQLFLTPGMFGNMRLSSGGTTHALMVPDTAVQTDQARKLVLVVGADGRVVARPVVLGPVVDGLRIVRSGLTARDRVIIGGAQAAMPGSSVQVRPGRIQPAQVAETPLPAAPDTGQATFAAR